MSEIKIFGFALLKAPANHELLNSILIAFASSPIADCREEGFSPPVAHVWLVSQGIWQNSEHI